ncbi:MAG: cytidylate kinase-like family protein [Deltaproteobacteria bacterium]|nr:cytidylate kinase-like family protein [Deltaproteobacteria bacterium]
MPSSKVVSEKYRLLADRQIRRWDLQQRAGEAPRPKPCVAISRLPGAGGAEVGRRVAEALDYGFFGREAVDEMGRGLGVDDWLMSGLDEHVRTAIDRFVLDFFNHRRFTESDYLRHVTRAIATLGRRGSAVIVGRGAAFILSAEEALRVLLVAPRPARVERYAKVKEVSAEQAEQLLERAEEQRGEFLQAQFGVRQDASVLYDLVINTARFGFDNSATLILEALRSRFS